MLLQGCSLSMLEVWALFKAKDEASSCSLSMGLCILPMVKETPLSPDTSGLWDSGEHRL